MVPCSIAAGSTLLFTVSLSGYPATGGTLNFVLNIEGAATVIAATASGTDFIVSASSSATAAYKPGRYFWALIYTATGGSVVTKVCQGELSVTPNLGTNATPTPAQTQLALLDAQISTLLATPNVSVSFNGQSFTSRNFTELFGIRDRLQARVTAELYAMGLSTKSPSRHIATRFC